MTGNDFGQYLTIKTTLNDFKQLQTNAMITTLTNKPTTTIIMTKLTVVGIPNNFYRLRNSSLLQLAFKNDAVMH